MTTKEDIQFWLFVFCIADNLNQHLRKPLPNDIERMIARKFIAADRLSLALLNIYYQVQVDDELNDIPTEEEEWLKKIRKDRISGYTKGGLISESFSLWLKYQNKKLNYSL